MHKREAIEIAVMASAAGGILLLHQRMGAAWTTGLIWAVVVIAAAKTAYYFAETLWHLVRAAASDLAYHRFLMLMAYNMAEVTVSFAIDFYCLQVLDFGSFTGIAPKLSGAELAFECFYFSVLNFSFFGYGDITPAHIPAKIVMLMEVITAFSTVIFLISDFVSMKESMRKKREARS
ncbi:MAG: ion channel [Pirellulales bacterium]